MTDIPISDTPRRVEYTGNTGTGPYSFAFNILGEDELSVCKVDASGTVTALTLTTDYTVSLNADGTGSITLVVALVSTDVLIITGATAIERQSDYQAGNAVTLTSLNSEFDKVYVLLQQLAEELGRSIKFKKCAALDGLITDLNPIDGGYVIINGEGSVTTVPSGGSGGDYVEVIQPTGDPTVGNDWDVDSRKLTAVAAGTANTDAANYGQIKDAGELLYAVQNTNTAQILSADQSDNVVALDLTAAGDNSIWVDANDRFVIPAAWDGMAVRVMATIEMSATVSDINRCQVFLRKNGNPGAGLPFSAQRPVPTASGEDAAVTITSAPITVTTDDYFDIIISADSTSGSSAYTVTTNSWASIEVITQTPSGA